MEFREDIGHICLTVKEKTCIHIGDDIKIYIIKAGGHGAGRSVRLRVSAPKAQKVFRTSEGKPVDEASGN